MWHRFGEVATGDRTSRPRWLPQAGLFTIKDLEMAGATGLEPATSAVTGQCSNQLRYTPAQGDAASSGREKQREKT